uniref:Lipocalin n=1 Tax=Steinernema glaseri TaxID=37863 RepID=A0A1I7Y861_9BILA
MLGDDTQYTLSIFVGGQSVKVCLLVDMSYMRYSGGSTHCESTIEAVRMRMDSSERAKTRNVSTACAFFPATDIKAQSCPDRIRKGKKHYKAQADNYHQKCTPLAKTFRNSCYDP